MCGIAGFITHRAYAGARLLRAMLHLVRHRGPDDEGYLLAAPGQTPLRYAGPDAPEALRKQWGDLPDTAPYPFHLGLGFRRFAVQDTSADGAQPMERHGVWLVFNGEIYNCNELKKQLYSFDFQTNTDTEVLLAAYLEWGTDCFRHFRGPFSVVLYDGRKQAVVFARDHLGESPLYWLEQPEGIYFASDIKPLFEAVPDQRSQINEVAVVHYLEAGLRDYQHQTFWQNIRSFPNGQWMVYHLQDKTRTTGRFWALPEQADYLSTRDVGLKDCITQTRALLLQAVARQSRAARNVGMALSGGVDSSAIAAALAVHRERAYDSFTVSYEQAPTDETAYAQAVREAFPGRFRPHLLDGYSVDFFALADAFFRIAEEPFHDPVHVVEWQLYGLAKAQGVSVLLHGAGGDEVFAGYDGFTYKPFIYKYLYKKNPVRLVCELPFALRSESRHTPWSIARALWRKGTPAPKSNVPGMPADLYGRMRGMLTDFRMNYWLRSHKLAWSWPVEPRFPFLDVDVVTWGLKIPPAYLIRNGLQKYPLRQAFAAELPEVITQRSKKTGFPFETDKWLFTYKKQWFNILQELNTPWFKGKDLALQYDNLCREDSELLWRLLCLGGWYNSMVLGKTAF